MTLEEYFECLGGMSEMLIAINSEQFIELGLSMANSGRFGVLVFVIKFVIMSRCQIWQKKVSSRGAS